MSTLYDFFEMNGLINICGVDSVVYYDTRRHRFEVRERSNRKVRASLVKTPYKESFNRSVWKRFWESLTPEENALANSFDEKHGFFDFMRETGLIDKYNNGYEDVAEEAIKAWITENDIVAIHTFNT